MDEKLKMPGSPLDKSPEELGALDVYDIAALLGRGFERALAAGTEGGEVAREAVHELMAPVIRVLEMLEALAVRNGADTESTTLREQLESAKRETITLSARDSRHKQELELVETYWREREEEMMGCMTELQEENRKLDSALRRRDTDSADTEVEETQAEGLTEKERDVMVKLKEVVDKQRDEIRAKDRDISQKNEDVEALQQQLSRLIKINNELRHKLAVMEAQGKSLIEQKVELEADLQSREQEIGRLRETAASVASAFLEQSECQEGAVAHHPGSGEDKLSFFPGVEDEEDESVWMDGKLVVDLKDPNRPRFTLQELREVLQERNELKAKLFLLQEELAYYKSHNHPWMSGVRKRLRGFFPVSEDSDLDPSPPVRALPSQHAIVKPSPQDSGIRRLFSFFYKDRPAGMRKLSVESTRPGEARHPATAPEQRLPNDGEAADASGLTGSTATLKSISLNP
ncbi:RILP-like protein 1 isoform X3 [Lethenteron reissneri]|nr:RILP-like protein 1 isoform X3 [Lethenteron reissneri]XP_061418039.1 RILP-like protein 1 isoform X3 [Lethenteron reissneri]XP_061418040.1 RILP-like protein 1 isoform X3 [Lethenteron reissneri]